MKKTIVAALTFTLMVFLADQADAQPAPVEPAPPAAPAAVDPTVRSGPVGTPIQVSNDGDMAVIVRPTDTTVPPREIGNTVLTQEVTFQHIAGNPSLAPDLDLFLVTTDGELIAPLTDVPGGLVAGPLEPGETRTGIVAFELRPDQTAKEVVYAPVEEDIQGTWTL
ncbi:hypothetical protein [Nocardia paucivorans]|uniref:hypothetical protein n=1 Tax=Nocardia paucivorans TaxID=114259 RepID=UPI0003062096|nr:hypothetical protein [Nocardia paucivorans]